MKENTRKKRGRNGMREYQKEERKKSDERIQERREEETDTVTCCHTDLLRLLSRGAVNAVPDNCSAYNPCGHFCGLFCVKKIFFSSWI